MEIFKKEKDGKITHIPLTPMIGEIQEMFRRAASH